MFKHDRYFAAWALVLPVTSILVFPSVQGTTPAFLFALAILFPGVSMLVMPRETILPFYWHLASLVFLFLCLTSLAQLSLAFSNIRLGPGLPLVDSLDRDRSVLARNTMFTQSIYLLACLSTFSYVRTFYSAAWDHYFLLGASLLGLYGVYECLYFLALGTSGDFLSNRNYDAGVIYGAVHTGSWAQTIHIGPITMERLKSLTGEPSMYAFAILPFCIYALHTKRISTYIFLLITLLMSTSTTAMLGLLVYLILRFWFYGLTDKFVLIAWPGIIVVIAMGLFGNTFIVDAYSQIVETKLALQSVSGSSRFDLFLTTLRFFLDGSFFTQLFGIGFGYVRSTDFFSTVLVNLGIVGLTITLCIFLYPVYKLGNTDRDIGIKAALIVILTTLMISVPDYNNLPIWLFLGIAYNEVNKKRAYANIGAVTDRGRLRDIAR